MVEDIVKDVENKNTAIREFIAKNTLDKAVLATVSAAVKHCLENNAYAFKTNEHAGVNAIDIIMYVPINNYETMEVNDIRAAFNVCAMEYGWVCLECVKISNNIEYYKDVWRVIFIKRHRRLSDEEFARTEKTYKEICRDVTDMVFKEISMRENEAGEYVTLRCNGLAHPDSNTRLYLSNFQERLTFYVRQNMVPKNGKRYYVRVASSPAFNGAYYVDIVISTKEIKECLEV